MSILRYTDSLDASSLSVVFIISQVFTGINQCFMRLAKYTTYCSKIHYY
jgi:hypothetical protein